MTPYDSAVIDLLGVLAYGELSAFERLCADAALAPTLDDKAEVAAMACAEFGHFQQLRAKLTELGVSAEDAMRPFVAPLDAFHASTAPADWLEGLVKAYVGDGIAADFYREISVLLDDETRALGARGLRRHRPLGLRRAARCARRSRPTPGWPDDSHCGGAG